jgi:uncharacterized coiled-coil protein SlyX
MFGKIFKGIAVAVGVGFAVGVMAGKRSRGDYSARNTSKTKPVLDRLERIESRIAAGEARPSHSESIAELDSRVERQSRELESLRARIDEHRQEVASDLGSVEKRLAEVATGVPALIESIITPRSGDFELRLRAETQQTVRTALTTFERTIEDKVSDRISVIEKAMVDQSAAVASLSQRAIELEIILQRLISGVEKLCDRTSASLDGIPHPAAKEPSFIDSPFQVRTNEAA